MEERAGLAAGQWTVVGSLALALVWLLLGGALHRWAFRAALPERALAAALQRGLRGVVLVPGVLFPLLLLVQANSGFHAWVDEVWALLSLAVLVVGVEALFSALRWGVVGGGEGPSEGSAELWTWGLALVRGLTYLVVVIFFLGWVLPLERVAPEQVGLLWVLLFYLGLYLIYRFVFRVLVWRHPLLVRLRDRLRPWAFVALLMATLLYAAIALPWFSATSVERIQQAAVAVGCVLILETSLVLIFDYYFAELRRFSVPSLFRDLSRGLGFVGLGVFVLGAVFKQDLSTVVLGSTVVSVILGLALQETLGNFFAGLALGVSKPYTIGDSILVSRFEGRVEKIDWRSTVLRTSTGDYQVLPNSVVAKEIVQNFSAPTRLHARFIDVGVHYRHPPNEVRGVLLAAVATVDEVASEPLSEVWVMQFADSSIQYRLRYWMHDYSQRFPVDSAVREAIWYHFARAGIEIPYPMRNVIHHQAGSRMEAVEEIRALLDQVDFLAELSTEEKLVLARRVRPVLYGAGETVFSQGQPGGVFYIIRSGRLRVVVRNPRGLEVLTKDMAPGGFFGEMALLTGEPRSASVRALVDSHLLAIDKEALRDLLLLHPHLDQTLSEALARRQLRTMAAYQSEEPEAPSPEDGARPGVGGALLEQLSEQFLSRIRTFFAQ